VHPILSDRRSLLAYAASWLVLSWVPASIVASPAAGGFLPALLAAALPTLALGAGTLPLYFLCRALPLRPANVGRVLRLQLGMAVVWSLAWWLLLAVAARLVDRASGPSSLAAAVEDRIAALVAVGALLYLAAIAFHYAVASTRRARASELRAAASSLQAREAQLALLRAQVHPHFLFNSLHAIGALTVQDPKRARTLCALLAEFLRGSLAMGERGTVTLAEELALARTYLDVEKVRLGDRLAVEIDVRPPAGEARIPALLLQPLVENAVTHGVATCTEGGTLSIAARTTPGMLEIVVTNPFDPAAPPRRAGGPGGVGLANVERRLAACSDGAQLTTRRDVDRFTSTVVLPAIVPETPDGARAPEPAQGPDRR
jgi:hypothetical protein